LRKCAELHDLLQVVAFMLFIVGTILFVLRGFSAKSVSLHLVRILVLTEDAGVNTDSSPKLRPSNHPLPYWDAGHFSLDDPLNAEI
jgi:hypothetical protein